MRWKFLALLILITCLMSPTSPTAAQAPATASQAGPLLPQAKRLFSLDGSFSKGGVDRPWLSDHELLHFEKSRLYRYDIVTKADLPLPALTQQVVNSPAYEDFLDVSPNGQWVLWGQSANGPIFASPVDGSRRLSWPGNGGLSEPYWCADGHHWLQVLSGMEGFSLQHPKMRLASARLFDANVPDQSQVFRPLPPGLNGLDVLGVASDTLIVARTPDPMSVGKTTKVKDTSGGTEFFIQDKPTLRAVQRVSVWSLHQNAPLHQWTVRLPGQVQEVTVSANGDRAAWLVSDSQPKTSSLHMRTSLWVSGLDGSRLREVGFVEATFNLAAMRHMSMTQMEHYTPPLPLGLRWSPSADHLSFMCSGSLWVVAVP